MRSAAKTERGELGDLVFHQRDQRADNQGGTAEHDAGKLIAERFSGARRHHEQGVGTGCEDAADLLLIRPERLVAEALAQDFERCTGYGGSDWGRRCCGCGHWRLARHVSGCGTDFADDVTNVIFDSGEERCQLGLTALDALQVGFPHSGHGRALDLGVHDFDQTHALVGRFQALPAADNELALDQHFDDLGSRGGCAEARFLHGVREFFIVERFARRFHGGEERRFGEALRRAGLPGEGFDINDLLPLAFGEIRREGLTFFGRRAVVLGTVRFLLARLFERDVEHLPPLLLDGGSARMKAILG